MGHLRPYALLAYITGFNSNNDAMLSIETRWKQRRNRLIRHGINDVKAWARCGSEILSDINEDRFGVSRTELTLICLFND